MFVCGCKEASEAPAVASLPTRMEMGERDLTGRNGTNTREIQILTYFYHIFFLIIILILFWDLKSPRKTNCQHSGEFLFPFLSLFPFLFQILKH